jgi:hypothetical protein
MLNLTQDYPLEIQERPFMETNPDGGIAADRLAPFSPEPDYGAADYLRLPDFGLFHYSLTDAALLAALDMWASGRAPGVPSDGWEVDQDAPELRKALEPLRLQLLTALVRSTEVGQLPVEVRARNFADSRALPERTFVRLEDLVEWLEVHGHERGDIIADIEESLGDDPWLIASEVAEDRARLRLGHLKEESTRNSADSVEALQGVELEGLRRELQAKRLHIVHLEQQLHAARGGSGGEKRLNTRQRRTLLTIIAAVCKKAGIDTTSRGAAAVIAGATEELGVPVSDDSIRAVLREIPDAIESRSR